MGNGWVVFEGRRWQARVW